MAFDGFTIAALVSEMDAKLTGGHIQKIAQPEADELLLSIKNNKTQYKLQISASPSLPLIHLTNSPKPSPFTAPGFCMLLRKHLGGAKILSFEHDAGPFHLDVPVGPQRVAGFDVAQPPFERTVVAGDFVPASHVAFQFQPPHGAHVDVSVPTPVEERYDDESQNVECNHDRKFTAGRCKIRAANSYRTKRVKGTKGMTVNSAVNR